MQWVYDDMPWMRDLISVAGIFTDALRWMGWLVLVALSRFIDGLYGAVNTLLGLNIMQIEPVQQLVETISPLSWVLLGLALVIGAIFVMTNPFQAKLPEFARGIILSILLIVSVPFMFTALNGLKDAGVADIGNVIAQADIGETPGQDILRSLTWDVKASQYSGLAVMAENQNPYYLDINQRLEKEEPFMYKITNVVDGRMQGEKLGEGFFGMGEDRLYAYRFDFINLLIILLITVFALVFVGIKVAGIMYDLAFQQIISPLVFATDLHNSGRSKKLVQTVVSSYIILILVLLLLKLYLSISTWCAAQDFNILVRIFILAGAAKGLIDGPDIIVRLLGMDAGVKGAAGGLASAYTLTQVARGAVGLGKMAGKMVTKAPARMMKAGRAAAKTAGALSALPQMGDNFHMGQEERGGTDFGSAREVMGAAAETAEGKNSFARGRAAVGGVMAGAGFAYAGLKNRAHNAVRTDTAFTAGSSSIRMDKWTAPAPYNPMKPMAPGLPEPTRKAMGNTDFIVPPIGFHTPPERHMRAQTVATPPPSHPIENNVRPQAAAMPPAVTRTTEKQPALTGAGNQDRRGK